MIYCSKPNKLETKPTLAHKLEIPKVVFLPDNSKILVNSRSRPKSC